MSDFIKVSFVDPALDHEINAITVAHLNAFHGANIEHDQVLKSAAGYYIGSLYYDEEMGGWFPEDRISMYYYGTREEAEQHLVNNTFARRIFHY